MSYVVPRPQQPHAAFVMKPSFQTSPTGTLPCVSPCSILSLRVRRQCLMFHCSHISYTALFRETIYFLNSYTFLLSYSPTRYNR